MDAVIISTGTELITGQLTDTNAVWLASELTTRGFRVTRHVTVGDDLSQLTSAIQQALQNPGFIVVTGGLGPTQDDVTRQALAAGIGTTLNEDPEALLEIHGYFESRGRKMHESNRLQALVPGGCRRIPNRIGTAPGIYYRAGETVLAALPGVPAEMFRMFETVVAQVTAEYGIKQRNSVRVLRTFGMSEAQVGELLGPMMQIGRNPSVGTTASHAVISTRIVAQGQSLENADQLAASDAEDVRRRLCESVFGEDDDTLQSVVGRLLLKLSRTVCTAESCTGGLLAKMLTDVPGSSGYFPWGFITYSNEAKQRDLGVPKALLDEHGAVSSQVAEAMAAAAKRLAGTDYALAITGIAGPTGGRPPDKPIGLVHVALAGPGEVRSVRLLLGETLSREEIRDRSCKSALNMLRLALLRGS